MGKFFIIIPIYGLNCRLVYLPLIIVSLQIVVIIIIIVIISYIYITDKNSNTILKRTGSVNNSYSWSKLFTRLKLSKINRYSASFFNSILIPLTNIAYTFVIYSFCFSIWTFILAVYTGYIIKIYHNFILFKASNINITSISNVEYITHDFLLDYNHIVESVIYIYINYPILSSLPVVIIINSLIIISFTFHLRKVWDIPVITSFFTSISLFTGISIIMDFFLYLNFGMSIFLDKFIYYICTNSLIFGKVIKKYVIEIRSETVSKKENSETNYFEQLIKNRNIKEIYKRGAKTPEQANKIIKLYEDIIKNIQIYAKKTFNKFLKRNKSTVPNMSNVDFDACPYSNIKVNSKSKLFGNKIPKKKKKFTETKPIKTTTFNLDKNKKKRITPRREGDYRWPGRTRVSSITPQEQEEYFIINETFQSRGYTSRRKEYRQPVDPNYTDNYNQRVESRHVAENIDEGLRPIFAKRLKKEITNDQVLGKFGLFIKLGLFDYIELHFNKKKKKK